MCTPTQKVLCGKKSCKICIPRSFWSFSDKEKVNSWNYEKNKEKPWEVRIGSGKKYWFYCDKCEHDFNIGLDSITNMKNMRWCCYCTHQKLCPEKTCDFCFKNSFASHKKSEFWSEKNKISPRFVTKCSGKEYWFLCKKCCHNFRIKLSHVNKGSWCQYCSIPCKMLCKNLNCDFCFKNSFASHEKSEFWSKKNKISARFITKSSGKKFWFDCRVCGHDFEVTPANISSKKPNWCPYCSFPCKKLCENENCDFCFKNSFASHEKSRFWSEKNTIKPRFVIKNSNKKFMFDCPDCKKNYIIGPGSISSGTWCSCTLQKTAKKLHEHLETLPKTSILLKKFAINSIKVEREKRFDWCKNVNHLPFDFFVTFFTNNESSDNSSLKILIELDGDQHFRQVSNWRSHTLQQEIDFKKMLCAVSEGISVIRLYQPDVFEDKNEWQTELDKVLSNIIENNYVHAVCIGEIYRNVW